MKNAINKMHKFTRFLDIGLCFFLSFWFVWAVINDKDAFYLSMLLLSIIINVLMLIFQPSKRITDRLLASGIKKRSV